MRTAAGIAGLCAVLAAAPGGCRRSSTDPAASNDRKASAAEHASHPAGPPLAANRAAAPPVIDGELSEQAWLADAKSPPLADTRSGRRGSPYAEARALWDDRALYLAFYVADMNLETRDRIGAIISGQGANTFEIAIDPRGTLHAHPAPAPAGVRGAVDSDGTVNRPSDDDEEWTAEIAVPWSALGLPGPRPVSLEVIRHDRLDGRQVVMRWRGPLELTKAAPRGRSLGQ